METQWKAKQNKISFASIISIKVYYIKICKDFVKGELLIFFSGIRVQILEGVN